MSKNELTVSGTRLLLNSAESFHQGLSFFNAVYNPAFNRSAETRDGWLARFRASGVNALRIWCQWDFEPPRSFVDTAPEHTMYTDAGESREDSLRALAEILEALDRRDMMAEVVLFSNEKQPNLPVPAMEAACRRMAEALAPHRHILLQIWNENSTEVRRCFEAVKSVDPDRIVTNSPGGAGVLADDEQNRMLDVLTPHTVRRRATEFWKEAPRQIASLIERYGKPVIDDEPARTGTVNYGGIPAGTESWQHVEQIRAVRAAGGYHVYHHDMFQYPHGHPAIPPHGIPDPDFSPFHARVFAFLTEHRARPTDVRSPDPRTPHETRRIGGLRGTIRRISPDFDEPVADFDEDSP